MKQTSSILVAYPVGGERAALDLVPQLEQLGDVTLRKYEKVDPAGPAVDVALCVVTDDHSIDLAHRLQKNLDSTPTLVVDHTAGRRIPVNGFAGLTPPSPAQIAEEVEKLLEPNVDPLEQPFFRPQLTGRLGVILSRLGGLSGTTASMLAASARQLSRDLRAERAEAWVIEQAGPKRVVAINCAGDQPLSPAFVSAMRRCIYPMPLAELTQKADRSLREYLVRRGLNVFVPLQGENLPLGWIALQLRKGQLTDSFLDDLQIAAHLLSTSLLTTLPSPETKISNPWDSILSSFGIGILRVDHDQQIGELIGDVSAFGSEVRKGDSVEAIRNSRVRELIVEALNGNYLIGTWDAPSSHQKVRCSTVPLEEGAVAVQIQTTKENAPADLMNIQGVMESLPMTVTTDADLASASFLISGKVRRCDVEALKRCAASATASQAKSLRLRVATKSSGARGVLFFETPANEVSNLADDLTKAVTFDLHA